MKPVNTFSKKTTLADVARAAGVSRAVAGHVLLGSGSGVVRVSGAKRARIEELAAEMSYAPNRFAQGLRGISSRTFAVLVDSLNTPVMSNRLAALEIEAAKAGYRLLVGQCHENKTSLPDFAADFEGRAVDAVLCLFDLAPDRDRRFVSAFKKKGNIVFHAKPAWSGGCAVRIDTDEAVRLCVDHLLDIGRDSLALALWNEKEDGLMAARREAFLRAVSPSRTGRACRALVWDARSPSIAPSREKILEGIEKMVRKGRVNAILASNDIWALHFLVELEKAGIRVPGDVAVVGYDNLDIGAIINPSLTTIDQSHAEYARRAVAILLALARGELLSKADRVATVNPQLVVRGSTIQAARE